MFSDSHTSSSCRKNRRCHRGFTLVEMLAVLVLLSLVAAAVTVGVRGYLIAGKQKIARVEIAKICQALEAYATLFDNYPSSDQGLEALTQPNEKFAVPPLDKIPKDPWGNSYDYIQPGPNGPYQVICYGADNEQGGDGADADISSDELSENE